MSKLSQSQSLQLDNDEDTSSSLPVSQQQQQEENEKDENVILCVATTKPCSSLTPGGGGGALTLVCPWTGSILSSSFKSNNNNNGTSSLSKQYGMSSISILNPTKINNNKTTTLPFQLLLTHGSSSSSNNNKDDTFAFLYKIPQTSSSLLLQQQWKCRLPEPQMTTGLHISPCGNYIAAGGKSGTLYLWQIHYYYNNNNNNNNNTPTLVTNGSKLLCNLDKAHYRSIRVLAWSPCGNMILTGGDDGLLHVYSLLDLIHYSNSTTTSSYKNSNNKKMASSSIIPMRIWSLQHTLGITSLVPLDNHRRWACGSKDGTLTILDVCCQQILATIQIPHGISSLEPNGNCIFVGTTVGNIYQIDLELYSLYQVSTTQEQQQYIMQSRQQQPSICIVNNNNKRQRLGGGGETWESRVFSTQDIHQQESCQTGLLRGHEASVTCINFLPKYNLLVSGDAKGCIRTWRCIDNGGGVATCCRILHPWSHHHGNNNNMDGGGKTIQNHPISSMVIIQQQQQQSLEKHSADGMFASPTKRLRQKNNNHLAVAPLNRYTNDNDNEENNKQEKGHVSLLFHSPATALSLDHGWWTPNETGDNSHQWDDSQQHHQEEQKVNNIDLQQELKAAKAKIAQLEKRLASKQ